MGEEGTEEPQLIIVLDGSEGNPLNGSQRSIGAPIDVPRDIDQRCTLSHTEREQGHLCGGIDELIFQIGQTHRRDHTSSNKVSREE